MNYGAEFLLGAPPATMLLLKITGVLVVACLLNALLARGNPRWSVLMWRGTLLGLVVLAAGEVYTPKLVIAINVPATSIPTGNVPDVVSLLLPQVDSVAESHRAPDIVSVNLPPATAAVSVPTQPLRLTLMAWAGLHREPLLLGCWLGVVGILLLRMLPVAWRVRRATSNASKAPCDILELATDIARDLGCKPSVDVRIAAGLGSPYLAGIARPIIVLPECILAEASPLELSAILAHELTHVKSWDIAWLLLNRFVTSVLWFHPLAWRMLAAHGAACEGVCDAVAADYIGDRDAYSRTLAQTALAVASGAPGGGLPMVRGSKVLRRIRAVGRGVRAAAPAKRWIAASAAAGAALIGGLLFVGFARAEIGGAADGNLPPGISFTPITPETEPVMTNTVSGVVLDPRGNPVAGAPVQALSGWEEETERRFTTSDGEGRFQFEALTPEKYWCFTVDHPDYAKEWEREENRGMMIPITADKLPVRIQLQKPESLSGIIVDERDHPVGVVKVTMNLEWLGDSPGPVQGHEVYDLQATTADAEGRFTLTRLRPGRVGVVLEHEGHAQTRVRHLAVGGQFHRITINSGVTVSGVVVSNGQPVAGAAVLVSAPAEGARPYGRWTVITDERGAFRVDHFPDLPQYFSHDIASAYVTLEDDHWVSPQYFVFQRTKGMLPEVRVEATPGPAGEGRPEKIEIGKEDPARPIKPGSVTVTFSETPMAIDADQRPRVSLDGEAPLKDLREPLDESGSANFMRVPPGAYTVSVSPGATPHFPPQQITLVEGEDRAIVLEKGPAKLGGLLRGAEGRTSETYLRWTQIRGANCSGMQGRVKVSEDGHFEADGLNPGTYMLDVRGDNLMPNYFEVQVKEGENVVDLDLPPGRIEGRLMDLKYESDDRKGEIRINPTGVSVTSGNHVGFVHADGDGRFFIDHVPPGRYIVNMRGPLPNELLRADVTVGQSGEPTVVELRRPANTGRIAGKLIGIESIKWDEFNPISVSASLFSADGYEWAVGYWTEVQEDGSYALPNLPEGRYLIRLSSGFEALVPQLSVPAVEVRSGMQTNLDLTIPKARMVKIVLDSGERTPTRKTWALRGEDGVSTPYHYYIGSSPEGLAAGQAEFLLPLGAYTIEADFGDQIRAEAPIQVVEGEGVQEFVVPMPEK